VRPQTAAHGGKILPPTAILTPNGPIPNRRPRGPVPGNDEILFLPLGGCSRIGMNMALYGHAGKWLIVDAGVAFMGDEAPGIDAILADPTFIEERMADVVGLVVTHAHEDHIGAIHHLWPRLKCPIYASPFASHVIRERLKETGALRDVTLRTFNIGDTLDLRPFKVQSIAVTHSIPEPMSLAIRTPAGTVLHTGDWKFDPEPLLGRKVDFDAFRRLGDEGLLAMTCDSTNADVEGSTGSEAQARAGLMEVFAGRKGAIAVTGFASNVARMKAVAQAAKAHDRKVVLAGRSMLRMEKAARVCGFLDDTPAFLSVQEASWTDRRNLVLLCTGSQGEERAALSRIARNDHRELWLERGDTAVFSARAIPGNEEGIRAVQDHLRAMGVEIITPADAPVHVSGHPKRDDLRRMYDLVRPRFAVPVHGTIAHMEAHARLARECGVERALVPEDGDIIRLAAEGTAVIGHIEPKRLANDGRNLLAWDDAMLDEAALLAA
jgi:ribonuclease J